MSGLEEAAWVATVVGVFVAGFAAWREMRHQTKVRVADLNWRKLEFLIGQQRYLETDSEIGKLLEAFNSDIGVTEEQVTDAAFTAKLDKLLSVLNVLAFSEEEANQIAMRDIAECFGWYFTKVGRSPVLKNYCNKNGFNRVSNYAKKVERYFRE